MATVGTLDKMGRMQGRASTVFCELFIASNRRRFKPLQTTRRQSVPDTDSATATTRRDASSPRIPTNSSNPTINARLCASVPTHPVRITMTAVPDTSSPFDLKCRLSQVCYNITGLAFSSLVHPRCRRSLEKTQVQRRPAGPFCMLLFGLEFIGLANSTILA